ncbi:hypothetical protein BOTBODRAFT_181636 [Botryobasidium botryosum FD-172 SS1]|uniref:Retrotransposon gag domain-containing protein n=1 Tax=Botryobasidium botryosum (strain FD-172 SS1) TaxID=930990 RepID=A0A067LT05_BOTB1|nr:hypothetical protein BOTBODRAFT_181636 [Botryobasidium botryosum FD-172 SS1]
MNFLQLWGDEQQRGIDAWFENLLRETTNLTESQACDAFGFLLHAGSPADAWYEDLHDNIRLRWSSLVAAFSSVWPVSRKLLCADGALHTRRMEREEERARLKDEEVLRAVEQELEWATEEEDYMWWAYLEEKKRLALDARREAALDEDWAEFEDWERLVEAACAEDERVRREYEAQEIAYEEEDLAWRTEEERLEERWRAETTTLEAEGRRLAEELAAARARRVEGILRVVAEVEDRRRRRRQEATTTTGGDDDDRRRRRRQEATRRRTTAHCGRRPLYTTPAALAVPLNTTVTYPPSLETVAADVLEPTVEKPPDSLGTGVITSATPRGDAVTGRARLEREGDANGQVRNANELSSQPQRELSIGGDRRRGIVVLPPTKHPTAITSIPSIACPQLHDDERPPTSKHSTEPAPYPPLPRERLPCTANSSIPPWVDRLVRSLRPNDSSIAMQSLRTNDHPAPTKHPTAITSTVPITHPYPPSLQHDRTHSLCTKDSSFVAQSSTSNDRPAPTKHPTTRFHASLISIVSTATLIFHDGTRPKDFVQPPAVSDPPALTKHPTALSPATPITRAQQDYIFIFTTPNICQYS